jgi:hypothetical protein
MTQRKITMQLDSYAKAHNLFGKARNAAKGKPVGGKWRLFQDGEEYALYCQGQIFGRFLPNNTFRFCYDPAAYMTPMVYTSHTYTPIKVVRRSKGHYRVHVKDWGTETYSTATEYNEFTTGGYKLYDGMVLDLDTRLMVRYVEPKMVVDPEARTVWLRQLRATKRLLHTMAKLGAFTAMIQKFIAANGLRWEDAADLLRPKPSELNMICAALDGNDMHAFNDLVARSMFYHLYKKTDVQAQRQHIDAIFNTNSLELRRIRGVVEYK